MIIHRPNFYYSKVDFALSVHFATNAAAHMCVRSGSHGNKDQCRRRSVCMFRYLSFAPERLASSSFSFTVCTPVEGADCTYRKKLSAFQLGAFALLMEATFLPIASLSIIFMRGVFPRGNGEMLGWNMPQHANSSIIYKGVGAFSDARKISLSMRAFGFIVNNMD